MFVRSCLAVAAALMLSTAAFAQGGPKLTDPQISHIAYTAGVIDIVAAKQALQKNEEQAGQRVCR